MQTYLEFGILVDETHAVMTADQLAELMEYSTTVPTGVVPGKRWKRRVDYQREHPEYPGHCWYLGEYVRTAQEDRCAFHWRQILVVG